MRVAIITGAAGGIGSEFCRALDDQNLDAMFILGRNVESLKRIADELQTHVCFTTIDLSDRQALQEFCESLCKQDLDVRFLVNCAGFGTFGELSDQNDGDTTGMVDVNIIALTELSRVCIPMMERGSNIIQVCSASAYLPLPGLGVYAATKAYVRSFTESLRMELKDKGINVRRYIDEFGTTRERTVSIGNSYTDIGMFRESGLSIAFNPTDQMTQDAADHTVFSDNIADVLDYILIDDRPEDDGPNERGMRPRMRRRLGSLDREPGTGSCNSELYRGLDCSQIGRMPRDS